MFETSNRGDGGAIIKVIGVGGGGGNAVDHMCENNIEGVEFIVANTDSQALKNTKAKSVLQLGANTTSGLGAGADPARGQEAALEDRSQLADAMHGADMLFIATGLGGGTGTGASPVIAQIAKEKGILTVGVVTLPFMFEGRKRMAYALEGLKELEKYVDTLIVVKNEKLIQEMAGKCSLLEAFAHSNDVLCSSVRGISDIIKRPGMINVDFADVKAVMEKAGQAVMGEGRASGADRAQKATEAALFHPLLRDTNLQGAKGILVNISSNQDLTLDEYAAVGAIIEEFASPDARMKFGTVIDPDLGEEMTVTVVITGLGDSQYQAEMKQAAQPLRAAEPKQEPVVSRNPVQRPQVAELRPAMTQERQFDNRREHDDLGVSAARPAAQDHRILRHGFQSEQGVQRPVGGTRDLHQREFQERQYEPRNTRQSREEFEYAEQEGTRMAASRPVELDNRRLLPAERTQQPQQQNQHDDLDYLDIPAFLRRQQGEGIRD
ncbi:cell division protein FtsZ [Pseudomonas nitritireducens]|uniref:Cell division protein FtsZ n=1 Tax=Pseudomonas nitroreducens TaxID=46680 RepID=A0A7W7NY51_PSENT|nr:cell division protein FtsZ [Pseudomonas nitritireducens]